MGQRIIKARESLTDYSQSDMTRALGLREPTYGNYERGSRRMPPDVMKKFYILTGCSADYIYRGEGPMAGDDSHMQKLREKYQEADENVRRAVNLILGIGDE